MATNSFTTLLLALAVSFVMFGPSFFVIWLLYRFQEKYDTAKLVKKVSIIALLLVNVAAVVVFLYWGYRNDLILTSETNILTNPSSKSAILEQLENQSFQLIFYSIAINVLIYLFNLIFELQRYLKDKTDQFRKKRLLEFIKVFVIAVMVFTGFYVILKTTLETSYCCSVTPLIN